MNLNFLNYSHQLPGQFQLNSSKRAENIPIFLNIRYYSALFQFKEKKAGIKPKRIYTFIHV